MYRLRYAERKVYIVFDAHPISGVFFVCQKTFFGELIALCTRRGAFCFSWKALEYESNGKFSKTERRIFYDDRNYDTFEK
jgi:hypothetical protein